METIGSRIKHARNARQLTQKQVADHLGIKRVSVTQWEGDTTTPDLERIPALAGILDVSVEWLLEANGAPPQANPATRTKGFKPEITKGQELVRPHKSLPLYAAARGGDGHVIVTFEAIEYLKMPTILEGVRGGYGLLITGESMSPAYRPGDMALVNPNLPPQRDTDVVLYHTPPGDTGDTEAIIKRLDGLNDREWTLEQYQPPKIFKEFRADWPVCHRVVGKYNSR
ncbi:helix-turn-helix transcriptional regulator [Nitratireductor aquimarinus]|uniref:XRE family transcriptional regulator n=1 Tax=Nitratireductor TaxID=245876 RepID=UPI0019D33A95|nr:MULTISPECIES: XRE family transcriptional regulator [Nitratireductor]MBN7778863.1 helix-turn-helix transcriptional regulator [Nitratireductor pacificus]MBN7783193.1 helix-turn-helix transcriptional regulator [Nitratireductor pacificus]MBN7791997.1 helix-turn-helix transcriptional regulator [Nitratireductor aquimarinus]MBY6101262.1 helix-turn-helix domain-containing protein [Nitratireductor aquimarinus]MCA1262615.1 helix-turn-helix domain-containing protein [Nitratireductor aquimarinus]